MNRRFDPEEPELMDVPQPVSAALEKDLQNLATLNRHFGGYRLLRCFLKGWFTPGRTYRVLDLATGAGDVPRMMVGWARAAGITLKIDAVDLQPSTLEIARKHSAGFPEINFIRGDARTFTDPLSYDLVACSLALHHFSEPDAVKVMRRACELSHDKVLVIDLERSLLTTLCVRTVALFFSEPMTRHDAKLSLRRAFSFGEMDQLAQRAGWRSYGHCRFFPARQAIWISGKMESPIPPDFADARLDFAT